MVLYLAEMYVPRCALHAVLWSHIGTLMRLLAAEPRSTSGFFSPLWNDLCDPLFDGVGLAGFKSRANALLSAKLLAPFCLLLSSLALLSFYALVLWGWSLRTVNVLIALSSHAKALYTPGLGVHKVNSGEFIFFFNNIIFFINISVSMMHFYHWIPQDSTLFTDAWSVAGLGRAPPAFLK